MAKAGYNLKSIEFWMSGPVENIPGLLQPIAHTLLQVRREVNDIMQDFPEHLLWNGLAGMASPGFHLKHIPGVMERLFTYAKQGSLSPQQLKSLSEEGKGLPGESLDILLERLNRQVDLALSQLASTDPQDLTSLRGVGRKQLPSTVIGLLFHTAEHCMRHTGQLLVTAKALTHSGPEDSGSQLE
jgi:uncharacterized damage-inducible protein DinB